MSSHEKIPTNYSDEIAPWLLAAYVREVWSRLGTQGEDGEPLRLAVYGAGDHSRWLEKIVRNTPHRPIVAAVLDDQPQPEAHFWKRQAIRPEELDPSTVDAIVISSDTHAEKIKARCAELFKDRFQVIHLYEGLPPGPYPKKPAQAIQPHPGFNTQSGAVENVVRTRLNDLKPFKRIFVAGVDRSGKTMMARVCAKLLGLPYLSFDDLYPWLASSPARTGEMLESLSARPSFALDAIPPHPSELGRVNEWLAAHPALVLCVYCPDEDEWFRRMLNTWYFQNVIQHAGLLLSRAQTFYEQVIPALKPAELLYYDSAENAFATPSAFLEWIQKGKNR